jgi:hypothetical protein
MYDIEPQDRTLDSVLESIALYAIVNDLHRDGNAFYHFTEDELHIINGFLRLSGRQKFTGGYVFTDTPDGKIGMISLRECGRGPLRLYDGQDCNPKWNFEETDGGIEVELC